MVAGEDLGTLDEDALARFRGRNIGIVFQSFHLIPTMTALENVAVPLELAGRRRRLRARRDELAAVGVGERLTTIRRSCPAASSSAWRSPARSRPTRRSASPTSRPAISTRPTGARSSISCSPGMRNAAPRWCWSRTTRRSPRAATGWCGCVPAGSRRPAATPRGRRGAFVAPFHPRGGASPLAAALRRCASCARACAASHVFIACIALGVMAIAGVGSLASEPRPRASRARAASSWAATSRSRSSSAKRAPERAFLERRGASRSPPPCAPWRAQRRALGAGRGQGGRCRLSALRHAVRWSRRSRWPRRWPSVTARSAPPPIRPCSRGSISSRARASRSAPPRSRSARCSTSEPDKLPAASASARASWSAKAALRATGLLQPGSLVRWHYRLRLPDNDAGDRACACRPRPRRGGNCRRPAGRSAPRQCLAAARAQRRALHAVPHAGRAHGAAGRRRRRRQRGQEPSRPQARGDRHAQGAGRDRRRVFAIYLTQVLAAGAARRRDRASPSAPRCRS